ncbi:MAG: 16S rRNA (cytidine(1402)-2'-O)-methyltransferase [Selenomonadaceae bacterium]|nr:16S rRNA (cytidine(1402)-2'-O)-methyltransferase [Selenomonadaceae bacterium]
MIDGKEPGELYLVATPIGNLEDITLRALRILKEVPLIAAEDTRHTVKLLNRFDIRTELTPYHEHNKKEAEERLIAHLLEGNDLALVSDAGLPCISDPGAELAGAAIEKNIKVTPIPGANAALSALIASGLSAREFTFVGFLPKTRKKCVERLESLKGRAETLIFYAAPHDIVQTLSILTETFGEDRRAAIARELTKTFEEFKRETLGELLKFYEENEAKGEFVIVVAGGEAKLEREETFDLKELYEEELKKGLSKKEAMREVAKKLNISRREVYNELLKLPL